MNILRLFHPTPTLFGTVIIRIALQYTNASVEIEQWYPVFRNSIDCNLKQHLNALLPIENTPGREICFKDLHFSKALPFISLTLCGMLIFSREIQPEKADVPKYLTSSGILIVFKDVHLQKCGIQLFPNFEAVKYFPRMCSLQISIHPDSLIHHHTQVK